jgi:hypothetical protein
MDLKYVEVDSALVANAYEKAVKDAVLKFSLVKKIFFELGLQATGTKWLSELIRH